MLRLNILLTGLVLAVAMTASCGSIVILDGIEEQGAGGSATTTGRGATSGGYTSGSGVGGLGGTGTTTGAGSSSSGFGEPATCAIYCKDIQANCTGVNKQYNDEATCLKVCSVLPPGKPSDTAGNTLGCRTYHAGLPSKAMPAVHCGHAGITGGDLDPADTSGPGICGSGCDAFCSLALKTCPKAWASEALCKADCSKFKPSVQPFSVLEVAGDTFNCRAYHLTVATQTPMPHCEHIKLESITCK
jgi:hypothetical protein